MFFIRLLIQEYVKEGIVHETIEENQKGDFLFSSLRLFFYLLTLLILLSLAAPLIPIDPNATDVSNMSQAPSWAHLFGTDEVGRDYFIRVVYGGRVSLLVGVLAMITATLIGTMVGLAAGYFGGWVDSLLMRLVDVLSSIPWLVLVIVLSVFLRPGLTTIIIVIGGFSWMNIARLIRGETLAAKEREYVVYGKFIGRTSFSIIFRHIFPAVLPTLIVAASASISGAIMTESALSFWEWESNSQWLLGEFAAKCPKQFATSPLYGNSARLIRDFYHLFI